MSDLHFSYAIHGPGLPQNPNRAPFIRFKRLEQAKEHLEALGVGEWYLVTEVATRKPSGGLVIQRERVVSAPMVWLPAKYEPEYEGNYLCTIERKNECGTVSEYPSVRPFQMAKFQTEENETVTYWMFVKSPSQSN